MTKTTCALVAMLALAVAPSVAHAGIIVEASLGKGAQVSPSIDKKWGPTNFMLAPGLTLGQMIRAELGFVMDMPNNGIGTNLRLRPMLVVSPPIIPLYGRLIIGVANLLDGRRSFEYGAALGVGASLAGIGLFAEAGVVPQQIGGQSNVILEGRAGGFYIF
jgi:hypothetical protein